MGCKSAEDIGTFLAVLPLKETAREQVVIF
jgi:hypothetical protein